MPAAKTNGSSRQATNSLRVAGAPIRTASVRFPDELSPGMSRRLLTTRRATDRRPTGAAARPASGVSRSSCTNAVPAVATRPKNTNTNSSPSPA